MTARAHEPPISPHATMLTSRRAEDIAARERELVERLRRGDEAAYAGLIGRYHASLVRLAMNYVHDSAIAEEVAQEAWLGLLRGLDRFEGRSSLKTWLFHILVNRARSRAGREEHSLPFSALGIADAELDGPAVEPERFLPPAHRWAGHWATPPREWGDDPERRLLAGEALAFVREAIAALPSAQRAVITLRDVEGLPAEEVCKILGLSETNQRVLLHRARSRVRRALEQYFLQE